MRFVLGLLDSSRVTLAVVLGIPLAIGVVVALGVRRRTPAFVLLAGSLVVAGIAVLSAWAVFQPARQQASGSTVESSAPGAGGSSAQQVSYSCTPSGTRLQETVKGITYQKNCLAAPADQPFTIEFRNEDPATPHDIHIYSADPGKDPNARSLFKGKLVIGPKTETYEVQPIHAGKYFFHCDFHPTQMMGGFVVGQT
ncbi:MAG TPA: cupredoxin domain-containing protein [Actinomycetota bacterium]|nr:cupredoxin domain-containing protein [Actinomycetota bacterium]